MNPQAAQNYLRTRVLTATPEQLQMMLFDGAIRFTEAAKTAIVNKDWEATYHNTSRAQKIITELANGLRPEQAPELCQRLAALYNYIYKKLVEVGIQHNVEAADESLKLLRFQRETWQMLMEKLTHQKAASAAAKVDIPAPSPRMEAALSVQG